MVFSNREAYMENLHNELKAFLLRAGADLVGFADVSDVQMWSGQKLRTAVALGVAYDRKILHHCDKAVDAFEEHLKATKRQIAELALKCEEYVEMKGFRAWTPLISTNLPGLVSDFSHKMAATKAGLGWVGKNCLFVSPKFGCGIGLASVLTDLPSPAESSAPVSKCGECMKCVDACPYGAIKGAQWHPGIAREKLLNAFLCSGAREKAIPKLGYKDPCGLCIKACPIGTEIATQENPDKR
jgi:epoxyqueuosine reductase QueG